MLDQDNAKDLVDKMAQVQDAPDPHAAKHHARIAVIDYSRAFRCRTLTSEQLHNLIDSSWLHLELAVASGALRQKLEEHFYRIRQRSIQKTTSCRL